MKKVFSIFILFLVLSSSIWAAGGKESATEPLQNIPKQVESVVPSNTEQKTVAAASTERPKPYAVPQSEIDNYPYSLSIGEGKVIKSELQSVLTILEKYPSLFELVFNNYYLLPKYYHTEYKVGRDRGKFILGYFINKSAYTPAHYTSTYLNFFYYEQETPENQEKYGVNATALSWATSDIYENYNIAILTETYNTYMDFITEVFSDVVFIAESKERIEKSKVNTDTAKKEAVATTQPTTPPKTEPSRPTPAATPASVPAPTPALQGEWARYYNLLRINEREAEIMRKYAGTEFLRWSAGTEFSAINPDDLYKLESVSIVIDPAHEPGSYGIDNIIYGLYIKFVIKTTFGNGKTSLTLTFNSEYRSTSGSTSGINFVTRASRYIRDYKDLKLSDSEIAAEHRRKNPDTFFIVNNEYVAKYINIEAEKNAIIKNVVGNSRVITWNDKYDFSNPYAFDTSVIYHTGNPLYIYQWISSGFIGSFLPEDFVWQLPYEIQFFIRSVPDRRKAYSQMKNSYLKYVGTETFTRGNGSTVILATFDLLYHE